MNSLIKIVIFNCRYENTLVSLENEIKHFLNAGNVMGVVSCREEGLKCLKGQLSEHKQELKEIYSKLYKMRGFSEDLHNSILHQLICMLVRLTTSENSVVSKDCCANEFKIIDVH